MLIVVPDDWADAVAEEERIQRTGGRAGRTPDGGREIAGRCGPRRVPPMADRCRRAGAARQLRWDRAGHDQRSRRRRRGGWWFGRWRNDRRQSLGVQLAAAKPAALQHGPMAVRWSRSPSGVMSLFHWCGTQFATIIGGTSDEPRADDRDDDDSGEQLRAGEAVGLASRLIADGTSPSSLRPGSAPWAAPWRECTWLLQERSQPGPDRLDLKFT